METNRNTQALKALAITLACLIYAGAVIYGDVMFISMMDNLFPDSPILYALSISGAVMTAASAIALPIALHWWFSPGLQFVWGIIFWLVDIIALALNSILAFAIANTAAVDTILATWSLISPATPLLAVIGWGVAFLLDPSHRRAHAEKELEQDLEDEYARQRMAAAKSDEVRNVILQGALEHAHQYARNVAGARVPGEPPKPSKNGRHYETETETSPRPKAQA